MISALGSSLSGIRAAFKIMDVSASNTANADTDGFKRQTVNLSEGYNGGVVVEIGRSNEQGGLYRSTDGSFIETSNTSYAEEVVTQMTAKHMLAFNAAALKTADRMYESIIDILA